MNPLSFVQYVLAIVIVGLFLILNQSLFAQELTKKSQQHLQSDVLTIKSDVLGESREVKISLPRGYQSSKLGYPLLVTLDGEFSFEYSVSVANYLERNTAVPPMVIVSIINTDRERDFTPKGLNISRPNASGDRFLDFIEQELMPIISSRYRLDGPKVLVGHSSGGIIASYALATRPKLFQAAIALDTPFHLDGYWLHTRLIERVQADEDLPIRLVVAESRFKYENHWQELRDIAPKNSILARLEIEDETHQSMPFQGLYKGLKTLFYEYHKAALSSTSSESVISTFKRLSEFYGAPIHPPRATYIRAIEDSLLQTKHEDADVLLQQLIKAYGTSNISNQLADRIAKSRDAKPIEETVEDLVRSEKASEKQISPYVGRWKGTQTSVGGSPSKLEFDIKIKDGKAVGRVIQKRPNGREDAQDLVVIRLKGETLELGYMNRMNPRGVLLNSLKLDKENKNLLVGQMTLAGMRFEFPNGRKIPQINIRVERDE